MSERISNHESDSAGSGKTGWEILENLQPPAETRDQWANRQENYYKQSVAASEQKLRDEQKAYNEAQWREKVEASYLVKNIEKREYDERMAEERAKADEVLSDQRAAERKRYEDTYIPKELIESVKSAELKDLNADLLRYSKVEDKLKYASRKDLTKEQQATYREGIAQKSFKEKRYKELLRMPDSQMERRLKLKKIAYEDAQERYSSMGMRDKLRATMNGKKLGKWEDVAMDYRTSADDLERMFKIEQ